MPKPTMQDEVRNIIVEQLGVDAVQVVPEANFIEDLGADSLDLIELLMALEELIDIEISDDEAEKIKTVGDVHNYIDAKGF